MTTERENLETFPEDQPWLDAQIAGLTFGRRIKAHRLCEEWTQEEAAQRLGISKQMLSAYETGRKLPTPKKAYEMAEKLGMMPQEAVLALLNDQLRQDNLPLQVELAG